MLSASTRRAAAARAEGPAWPGPVRVQPGPRPAEGVPAGRRGGSVPTPAGQPQLRVWGRQGPVPKVPLLTGTPALRAAGRVALVVDGVHRFTQGRGARAPGDRSTARGGREVTRIVAPQNQASAP